MPETDTRPLSPQQCLQESFGLDGFRPGQEAIISRLLDGKSAAAIFPTGGGKSLCYQLPAVLLEGLTLVVSPLLALMREQVDDLNRKGISAARIDSTLTAPQLQEVRANLRNGETKLLYVAPERFFNERFRQLVAELDIALFAIDEAHCISQWGHNFRPDYLKLAKIARDLNAGRVLALTATATPTVLDDIRREFEIAPEDAVQTPFYRENLRLQFHLCTDRDRDEVLLEKLSSAPPQATLVYVTLQKTAEQVAQYLQDNDLDARAYHAGLPDEDRAAIQDWFMNSERAIVVATIAFGMGVDKSDIRAIYHYNPSKSIENFAQEIGRAGRDGEPAVCETLLVPEDRVVLDNFAYADTPTSQSVRTFVEFLVGQPTEFYVSYYSLAYECDMRDLVVRTLLTYLELNGTLLGTAPRYDAYQFKPKVSSQEILAHFDGERRKFAGAVLSMSVRKKIWCEIKLAAVSDRLGCERSRIVKMLDYFAEKGWIELKASGLVHGYKKLQPITDIDALTQELYQSALERELGELARLNELYELMTSNSCQSAILSQHFGQELNGECGHCSACEGNAIEELPDMPAARVGDSALTGLKELKSDHPDLFQTARQQARFLCGLNSPKLIRKRLTKHSLFGCCNRIPFDYVLEALTS